MAVFCLVGVFALGLAACGDDDDGGGGGNGGGGGGGGGKTSLNLTIGDLVPLSGDLADFGPPGRKAADVAVDQIKQAIKESGVDHTVKIVHEDTQTEAQATVQAGRKVVGEDASCIAGAWASGDTIPLARSVSIREDVLQISPASTSDEITGLEDSGLINRTPPPDSFQGPALAQAIAEDLGGADGKTVNIGARNDAYGTGLADTFSTAWEDMGGTVNAKVIYDPEQPSYNSEAGQIVKGNPDSFVIIDFPETYSNVGPALARTGNFDTSKAWVTDGLISGDLAESAGANSVNGLRGTAPGAPEQGTAAKAFDQAYSKAGGPDRMTFDAQNFDAVILCYLAAVAAGSTEGADMADALQDVTGPGGTKYTFEQLPEAIKALQNGEDIDYEGASGPIDLNEDGDPTAGVYDVFEFKAGAPEMIDQVPLEGGAG